MANPLQPDHQTLVHASDNATLRALAREVSKAACELGKVRAWITAAPNAAPLDDAAPRALEFAAAILDDAAAQLSLAADLGTRGPC